MANDTNPMDMFTELLNSVKSEQKPLVIPDTLPQNQEVADLATRIIKAVLDEGTLSADDAAVLRALVDVRNSYMEF